MVNPNPERLEKVAEAIMRADYTVPEKAPTWDSFSEDMRDDYRCMAQAALDALQLKEELRVTEDGEQVAWPPSMEHAQHIVQHPIGDAKPVIERRLVSPWVGVQNSEDR